MAIVVEFKADIQETAETPKAIPSMLEINIHSNSRQCQAELKGKSMAS